MMAFASGNDVSPAVGHVVVIVRMTTLRGYKIKDIFSPSHAAPLGINKKL